jgi:hypothetical protein
MRFAPMVEKLIGPTRRSAPCARAQATIAAKSVRSTAALAWLSQ